MTRCPKGSQERASGALVVQKEPTGLLAAKPQPVEVQVQPNWLVSARTVRPSTPSLRDGGRALVFWLTAPSRLILSLHRPRLRRWKAGGVPTRHQFATSILARKARTRYKQRI